MSGKITHGFTGHYLYDTWLQMMRRCYSEDHPKYPTYGNRGITVCIRWHKVGNFIHDIETHLGVKQDGQSLDRSDNNKNYELSNVKWSTSKEQGRNRRSNRLVEIDGVTKCLSEWSEVTGISRPTINHRYHTQGLRGKELIAPVRKRN